MMSMTNHILQSLINQLFYIPLYLGHIALFFKNSYVLDGIFFFAHFKNKNHKEEKDHP